MSTSTGPALARVYPRLTAGGAESEILSLLRGLGPSTMVVTHTDDGPCGIEARRIAAAYTTCRPGHRLLDAIEALEGAEVVHLHSINNHPLGALAALLVGPRLLVQTVHNVFPSKLGAWVDHTVVPSRAAARAQPNAASVHVIGSGVEVPPVLSDWEPLDQRAVRIVEIRRPDKDMRFTMAELLATGLLDALPLEVDVLGVAGPARDPRIRHRGFVPDVGTWLSRADLLVHGSASESYGRVVYEAMAHGAVPVLTPLPVFTDAFGSGVGLTWLHGDVQEAAGRLAERIHFIHSEPMAHLRVRAQLHARARAQGSVQTMLLAHRELYGSQSARHRSVVPDDVRRSDLEAFAARAEALLSRQYLPGTLDDLRGPARGLLYYLAVRTGRTQDAIPALMRAHSLLGDRFLVLSRLGQALASAGHAEPAEVALARACELRPDDARPWRARVRMWTLAGQAARASAVLAEATASGALAEEPAALPR